MRRRKNNDNDFKKYITTTTTTIKKKKRKSTKPLGKSFRLGRFGSDLSDELPFSRRKRNDKKS